jgi:dihydroorotase
VLNAERAFLPHLHKIHERFPKLRIVLEHATTRAAVEAVKACGPTVACTITAHHIALTVDDWAGQAWNFCKPVAKYPDDRQALREVIKSGKRFIRPDNEVLISDFPGHPRFFLGSDSAPHPPHTKSTATPIQSCAAGVYTSPILLPFVAHLLESFGALDRLEGFVSTFGRSFYKRELRGDYAVQAPTIVLKRVEGGELIKEGWTEGEQKVIPFWSGCRIDWVIDEEKSIR